MDILFYHRETTFFITLVIHTEAACMSASTQSYQAAANIDRSPMLFVATLVTSTEIVVTSVVKGQRTEDQAKFNHSNRRESRDSSLSD